MENSICIIDSSFGIFIPQQFAQRYSLNEWGLSEFTEDIETLLEGPDNDFYWQSWDNILENAKHIDEQAETWQLLEDSDLFAVRIYNE